MPRLIIIALLSLFLMGAGAHAHDSPAHTIEDLTEHIQEQGESVPLLLNRAAQYRVMGQMENSVADLQRVLQMEPQHMGAKVELSRIYLAQSQLDTSLHWIQQAIGETKDANGDSHLYAARGDVYMAKADYASALRDYDRAIAGDGMQVDWYLNRSLVQQQLNRPDERIKGLWQGYEYTSSAVLYNEWVEALIDGGQAQRALRAIEPQLKQARLKSSWLIRRARARLALPSGRDHAPAAKNDLQAALRELDARLDTALPDADLLIDRALVHLLLNDRQAATQDISLAQNYGATSRQLERLTSYGESATPNPLDEAK